MDELMNPTDGDNPKPIDPFENNLERLLKGYAPTEVDDAFVHRVESTMRSTARRRQYESALRRVAGDSPTPGRRRPWRTLAVSAIAAAFLVGVGLLLQPPHNVPLALAPNVDVRPAAPADEARKRTDAPATTADTSLETLDRLAPAPPPSSQSHDRWSDTKHEFFLPSDAQALGLSAAPLLPGGEIRAKVTEPTLFFLDDGAKIYANEGAYAVLESQRRVKIVTGEVYFDIPTSSRNHDDFVVATPLRELRVKGTKFAVEARGRKDELSVIQGAVEASNADAPTTAGFRSLAERTQTNATAKNASFGRRFSQTLAWTRDLQSPPGGGVLPPHPDLGGAIRSKATRTDPRPLPNFARPLHSHLDFLIDDGFARVTVNQEYQAPATDLHAATFVIPLPRDASVSGLTLEIDGVDYPGVFLENESANDEWDQTQSRSGGLLGQWLDSTTFQFRLGRIPAGARRKIRLDFTQRLSSNYGQAEFRFPGGAGQAEQWSLTGRIRRGANERWSAPYHRLNSLPDGADLTLSASAVGSSSAKDFVLRSSTPTIDPQPIRIHLGRQDKNRFLLFRSRLTQPVETGRPRRDWIFLIETSADRDTVLSRTQTTILREFLNHAEPRDSISVIAVGAHPAEFREEKATVQGATRTEAITFVERLPKLGGLDLARGFQSAARRAEALESPWIVHLGSGYPTLGEARTGPLFDILPKHARYVGVGVGSRWNREGMLAGASRSAGFVTHIHPADPVAWRVFDLLATLDTPRLVGVAVSDPEQRLTFLCENTSLAHGDELLAVARLEPSQSLPTQLVISATQNRTPYRQVVPVSQIRPQYEFAPRVWAKLEIERLLAAPGDQRSAIIGLSKSHAVLSPYTSLLARVPNREPMAELASGPTLAQLPDVHYSERFAHTNLVTDNFAESTQPLLAWGKPLADIAKKTLADREKAPQSEPANVARSLENDTAELPRNLKGAPTPQQPASKESAESLEQERLARSFDKRSLDRPVTVKDLPPTAAPAKSGRLKLTPESAGAIPPPKPEPSSVQTSIQRESKAHETPKPAVTVKPPTAASASSPASPRAQEAPAPAPPREAPARMPDTFDREVAQSFVATEQGKNKKMAVAPPFAAGDSKLASPNAGMLADAQLAGGDRLETLRSYGVTHWDVSQTTNQNRTQNETVEFNATDSTFVPKAAGKPDQAAETFFRHRQSANSPRGASESRSLDLSRKLGESTAKRAPLSEFALKAPADERKEDSRPAGLDVARRNTGASREPLRGQEAARPSQASVWLRDFEVYPLPVATAPAPAVADLLDDTRSGGARLYKRRSFADRQRYLRDVVAHAPGLWDVESASESRTPAAPTQAPIPEALERRSTLGWQEVTLSNLAPGNTWRLAFNGVGHFQLERTLLNRLLEVRSFLGADFTIAYPELGLGVRRPANRDTWEHALALAPWVVPGASEMAKLGAFAPNKQRIEIPPSANIGYQWTFDFDPAGNLFERSVAGQIARDSVTSIVPLETIRFGKVGVLSIHIPNQSTPQQRAYRLAPAQAPAGPDKIVYLPVPLPPTTTNATAADSLTNVERWREEEALGTVARMWGANKSLGQQIVQRRFLDKNDTRAGVLALNDALQSTAPAEAKQNSNQTFSLFQRQLGGNFRQNSLRLQAEQPQASLGFLDALQTAQALFEKVNNANAPLTATTLGELVEVALQSPGPSLPMFLLDLARASKPTENATAVLANAYGELAKRPELAFEAAYEQGATWLAGGKPELARAAFQSMVEQTLRLGRTPALGPEVRNAFGTDWDTWITKTIDERAQAGQLRCASQLAGQVRQLGAVDLADSLEQRIVNLTTDKAGAKRSLLLVALEQNRWASARVLANQLTESPEHVRDRLAWRLVEQLAADASDWVAVANSLEQQALLLKTTDSPNETSLGGATCRAWFNAIVLASGLPDQKTSARKQHWKSRANFAMQTWRDLDPRGTEPFLRAAQIFAALGDVDFAWECLSSVSVHRSLAADDWANLARQSASDETSLLAERAFRQAAAADPESPARLLELANWLLGRDRKSEAVAVLTKIRESKWPAQHQATVEQAKGKLKDLGP